MPYLGRPVTNAGQFEIIDDISSSFNGSNTSFTLQVGGTNIQPDSANVTIALDGIIQIPSTAYSITGSTLNFSEAPESGTGFHGVLAGQSQFIESDFITDTHIKSTANISGSKINTDFSAQNIQITHITSSGNISGSSSSTISAGTFTGTFSGALSSSAQIASNISGSFTPVSTSLASRVTTNETDLTTLKGSGTTQGVGQSNSPTFAGGTVTGDFTVGGTITAQEVHTEFESASIVFTSGSTKFGDTTDDIHQMTGSLRITGSGDHYIQTGKVGIGVTNPSSFYESHLVVGDGTGEEAISIYGGSTSTGYLLFADSSSGSGRYAGQVRYNFNTNDLVFATNNVSTARMTIDSSGNVGIGNTDASTINSANNGGRLVVGNGSGNDGMTIYSGNGGGEYGVLYFADGTSGAATYQGWAAYYHDTNQLSLGTAGDHRVRITASGRVGIGTTSPSENLEISSGSNAQVGGTLQLTNDPGSSTAAGTSVKIIFAPHHSGTDVASITAKAENTGAKTAIIFGTHSGGGNAERVRINGDGKVGIGIDDPQDLLHVADGSVRVGTDAADYGQFYYSGGGMILINQWDNTSAYVRISTASDTTGVNVMGTGNVGIGTTSPNISGWNANYRVLTIKGDATNYGGVLELANPDSTGNYFGTVQFVNMDGGSGTVANARISGTRDGADDASALTFETEPTSGNVTERMRIDSTGRAIFHSDNGVTAPTGTDAGSGTLAGGATFAPNSVGRTILNLGTYNYTSEADVVRLFNQNGEVGDIRTNGSGASFNSNSDYRLKENQVTLSNALTRLNNLKPYRFNFKADPSTTLDGFFAHEVQEVVPEAVTGTKDQMMPIQYQPGDDIPEGKQVYDVKEYSTTEIDAQKMDASKLVPLLVKAVQELSAKVDALEG